ncbi:MAG: hypothetical protein NUV46_02510 [Nanoarchaeota archaeon]|nr:hypothetical protein [Nanoarchaeota archaeon]
MVYDLTVKELEYIYSRMLPLVQSIIAKDKNKLQRFIFEEAAYFEACYSMKSRGVPENWPEIKEAESLYQKGEIHEANRIIQGFWNEMDCLSSLPKEDIRYYGN